MPILTLQHPVRTPDNQLLLHPGTPLTEETLDAVINSQRAYSYQNYPLFSYGSVKEDCLNFFSTPPYATIFLDQKKTNDLLNVLQTVHLPIPILESLDYFKKYDFHTYSHVLMVFALSTLLAEDLIPNHQNCIQLAATGPTHDIGKICVPLPILKKTTPLTKSERGFVEHHALAGHVLASYYCKDVQHLACKVALDHHERRDGSGYPRGTVLRDPIIFRFSLFSVTILLDRMKPAAY